jgi:hypothetical protein
MLAAAESAQNGSPPPDLLQLGLDCAEYNQLPRAGGILEQEAEVVWKMRVLVNIFNSYKSMLNTTLDQQKWSESNKAMWSIVGGIERLKVKLQQEAQNVPG